ncbi:MAG: hypothetical protein Crog4KO_13680 [Crocinitomicaceae bacterium]
MQDARGDLGELKLGTVPRVGTVMEAQETDNIWKKVIVQVDREKTSGAWSDCEHQVLVYSQYQFREGDIILFNTDLSPIENSGNPGEFDAKSYWFCKNIHSMGFLGIEDFTLIDYQEPNWLDQTFKKTRTYLSGVIEESLPEKEASIARALLLGDKSKLSGETRESFGNAGAMHVLAISGLHVGIIMYLLFFALKGAARWISRNIAVIITLAFLWCFAGVTGFSPSVVRATLMFSLLLIDQQLGRSNNAMNTLFFSGFVILLINPLTLFDIGFQLSYGAMFGIFLFFDRITLLLQPRNWLLKKAWEGTALGISAQLFTIPLVLHHFHQFPNYFWLTNLGIMCLAGIILGIGMIFFLLHGIPLIKTLLAFLLTLALSGLVVFIDWVDSLPYGLATGFELNSGEIVLFLCFVIVLVLTYKRKTLRWMAMCVLVLLIGNWQWNRYEASNKKEWIIFNSNSPVIAYKQGGEVRAFYTGKKEKAERLLNAYVKVYPATFQLDSLQKEVTVLHIDGERFELEPSRSGIRIQSEDQTTFIRTRYKQPKENFDVVVDMPYLEPQKNHHNLSSGPFRSAL